MQFLSSVYGVFDQDCPQVYAFDSDVSLASDTALNAVPKCVFTLGVKGQANVVRGVKDGKRYCPNLKWAYNNTPKTDAALHRGVSLATGCSTDSNAFSWREFDNVFVNATQDAAQYYWGLVSATTGIGSSRLNITGVVTDQNGASYSAMLAGRYRTTGYIPLAVQLASFSYLRATAFSIDAGSYGYSTPSVDQLAVYADAASSEDEVPVVARYECLSNSKLFRLSPEDINFGQLIPGTRPKVQTFLTHTLNL